MISRARQLEMKLAGRKCPSCKTEGQLIQKQPRNYLHVRCCECGGVFKVRAA